MRIEGLERDFQIQYGTVEAREIKDRTEPAGMNLVS